MVLMFRSVTRVLWLMVILRRRMTVVLIVFLTVLGLLVCVFRMSLSSIVMIGRVMMGTGLGMMLRTSVT